MKLAISQPTANDTINLALDTLQIQKQALIFLGTKQSAEKTAEEIAKKIKTNDPVLDKLALDALHALSKPTKQCERLATCMKKGIAFHHSGLVRQQREAIENSFREGKIRIICSTPTLAMGLDLPAYRAIIRDLKRYGNTGMQWIPVLEYLQMSGRAGRPKFDTEGQAIAMAGLDKSEIYERYILGEPESIYSKLAVEPALRTYLLSLISTRFVKTRSEIFSFFSKTFWAHQYKDMEKLKATIMKMLRLLEEWEFITAGSEFTDASELDSEQKILPTSAGKRVAELYLDPLTAHHIINCMKKVESPEPFPCLLMVASTLEMRPLLRAGTKDYEDIQEALISNEGKLLQEEPSMYDEGYDDFAGAVKTAMFLSEWIEEKDEEYLLEKFRIRPGEIHAKIDVADWLLYSATELGRLLQLRDATRELMKIRFRVRNGVKEELLQLLKFKGIGRVRARRLYNNKITDIGAVKKADIATLSHILGPKIAEDIKKQTSTNYKDNGQTLLNN